VVLLGTGTPVPDPERSGPATAIVVDDSAYLVDFGPGVVRRAKAAVLDRGIAALEPANLKVAFDPMCSRKRSPCDIRDSSLSGGTSTCTEPIRAGSAKIGEQHVLGPLQ